MSEVKDVKTVEVPVDLKLTDEEIEIIEGLITKTKYPHDFIGELDKTSIDTVRKLVLMYHFAQGHMYSAVNQFLGDALPRMMGMGPIEPGLKD